jgi:hypothetical protein
MEPCNRRRRRRRPDQPSREPYKSNIATFKDRQPALSLSGLAQTHGTDKTQGTDRTKRRNDLCEGRRLETR